MKVIIIGAVAAGMSAAAKLRRLDKEAIINVYDKGNDVSYGACGMPYYIGGVIKEEQSLIARSISDFKHDNIDIFLSHEVITIVPETKTVTILNHQTNKIMFDTYDKLVIATGASPKRTYVSGGNLPNIFVFNSLDDTRDLKQALKKANKVAIIGGGYIGVELAENIANSGIQVDIIENSDQILSIFDYDIAKQAELALEEMGVKIHLRETLEYYEQQDEQIIVNTDTQQLEVDLVIEAIGIKPNTTFLREIGLDMLANGAIKTNEYMETSIKDIYAAGDCVAYYNKILKDLQYVPLATHANKAGRVVAENISGMNSTFDGVLGSTIIKVDKLALAKTGVGFDEVRKYNLDYDFIDINAHTRASYYPGGKDLSVRVIFERGTGILKGAQLVGEEGVSERINIIALAISKEMTAKEFSKLDFAYSPPYSPVHDPLLVATRLIKV